MADKPNINPTPKARFQSVNGNITAHRSMIELAAFDRAADAAMLELQMQLAMQTRDSNGAMAVGFRLQGAQEFLSTFKTLAEQIQAPTARKDNDNLPDLSSLKRQ